MQGSSWLLCCCSAGFSDGVPQPGILVSTWLSIAVIATPLLLWGAWRNYRRGDRQKGVLMVICALVLLANVAIQTI